MTEAVERNKKWTIMVYLAGDNDLPAFCISVLQQLEAVQYSDDVCVLACFDSGIPWTKGSRYFRINCNRRSIERPFDWEIHNDLVTPNGGNGNGDENGFSRPTVTEGLRKFISWSMRQHADADRFMLVLYGHGPVVAGQNFLRAENPPSFLRLDDLREVLSESFGGESKKLDILAFQNCVMNGVEIAYELREQADWMIGSQGLVLATGWPYEKIISTIVKEPNEEPKTIARNILKACARHMLDFAVMDRSSEQSLCDLEALGESSMTPPIKALVPAVKDLVEVLKEGLSFTVKGGKRDLSYPAICDAVRLARLEAQAYYYENFVDLFDFSERLLQKCDGIVKSYNDVLKGLKLAKNSKRLGDTSLVRIANEISKRCEEIRKAVNRAVTESYYIGSGLQYSHGLSIYFPWTRPTAPYFPTPMRNGDFWLTTAFDTYKEARFVKESGWGDFLKIFFLATLRNVRRADRDFIIANNLSNLDGGMVTENHHNLSSDFLPGDPQKSSPDTGAGDFDTWSAIKNYPRRNYLSPADEERRSTKPMKKGTKGFDPKSPPVSPWGWNIAGLVAEVIQKQEEIESQRPRQKVNRKPNSGKQVTRKRRLAA